MNNSLELETLEGNKLVYGGRETKGQKEDSGPTLPSHARPLQKKCR